MKELLKELGFEHLPMLSEFVNKSVLDFDLSELDSIVRYSLFITQPLTKGIEDGLIEVEKGYKLLYEVYEDGTIEQAINAGVKLKLKI